MRIGVIGIEHLHLFEMIDGLVALGVETVCHAADDGPLLDLYGGWRSDSERRSSVEVLDDASLDLIVLAGVPAERGPMAIRALTHGHHVLAAKPAVTSSVVLDSISQAVIESDRRWWVFYSERLTNRAVIECIHRVHSGEIGELVAVTGLAPHTLAPDTRPEWFFDPTQSGGILVDLGAHQADQLLALAGPGATEIVASSVANAAHPHHPVFQDVGRMSLRHTTMSGRVVWSDHRVDYLSPAGLGTWGDVRLSITGTTGTLEVRSNIDPVGQPGSEHLILVDEVSARRLDTTDVGLDWAQRLLADIEHRTDTFMTHDHVLAACDIALRAQQLADQP